MIRFEGFEKNLAKMRSNVENLSSATKLMRQSLSKWLGPDGLLNERQADTLAVNIKLSLWEQDFVGAKFPLHPFTLYMRERLGIPSKKIGVATGAMMNAIQMIPEGGGKFSVGIPPTEGEIREQAMMFEAGFQASRINPRGSRSKGQKGTVTKPVHEQPARPFFWPAVQKFMASEQMDKNIKKTIYGSWVQAVRKWQRFGGEQYGEGYTVEDFRHQAVGLSGTRGIWETE